MAEVRVSVSGVDAFSAALDQVAVRVRAATRKATGDGIRHARRRSWAELSRYYHPAGTPTPSPPGQPPARITGHLRGSLSPTGPYPTGGGFGGKLGPTAVYARIQELGGVTGRGHATHLPPRPYMRAAYDKLRADGSLRRLYVDAWRRTL